MIYYKKCLIVIISSIVLLACHSNDKKNAQIIQKENSIESIKEQIKEHPDSLMLKSNLIEAYRNQGFYDSAIQIADQELTKDSGSAYLWNIKASLSFENNDTLGAIKALEKAIDIYPLPEYLAALGTVYAEIKDKKSLAIANELLKSNRTKSAKDAYFIKGLYYNYTGEPAKAIPFLDSSLNLDFTYMYAYREKAIALYDLKKYTEAIKVLERAVTLQNNFDEGYYWLGRCYEKLGQPDEAITNYKNALLYDKDYLEAREALDRLQQKENK